MKIKNIINQKALPSFCTANFDVIESIFYFCNLNKLPCLIECTSNQVNQYGGYSNHSPKTFIKEVNNLRKKNSIVLISLSLWAQKKLSIVLMTKK